MGANYGLPEQLSSNVWKHRRTPGSPWVTLREAWRAICRQLSRRIIVPSSLATPRPPAQHSVRHVSGTGTTRRWIKTTRSGTPKNERSQALNGRSVWSRPENSICLVNMNIARRMRRVRAIAAETARNEIPRSWPTSPQTWSTAQYLVKVAPESADGIVKVACVLVMG